MAQKLSPVHIAAMVIGGVALVYFATRKKEEKPASAAAGSAMPPLTGAVTLPGDAMPTMRINSPQFERALSHALGPAVGSRSLVSSASNIAAAARAAATPSGPTDQVWVTVRPEGGKVDLRQGNRYRISRSLVVDPLSGISLSPQPATEYMWARLGRGVTPAGAWELGQMPPSDWPDAGTPDRIRVDFVVTGGAIPYYAGEDEAVWRLVNVAV